MRGSIILVVVAFAAVAVSHTRGEQPTSVHELGSLMPEETERESTTTAALRAEILRLKNELERERSSHNKPPRHQRALFTTPAPTPLTAVPTPVTPVPTTASPSASPSASPVPTTEGITTHAQLMATIGDTENSEVVIEADIIFPSQAPVVITSGSVSLFGNGSDGGRVTLDGNGHSRLFYILGGTLHLTFLNLANGTVPSPLDDTGGSIYVTGGGVLVIRSCDIRGGGPGIDPYGQNAYGGGAIWLLGDGVGATGAFHDVVFSNFRGNWGSIIGVYDAGGADAMVEAHFFGCQFLDSTSFDGVGAIYLFDGPTGVKAGFYDCLFERNSGSTINLTFMANAVLIVRCIFRENVGTTNAYYPTAGAGGLLVGYGSNAEVIDCVFERNLGPQGNDGGGMSVYNGGSAIVRNTSFLSNESPGGFGGSFTVTASSSLVCIECYVGDQDIKQFSSFNIALISGGSSLVMYNSTFAETTSSDKGFSIGGGSSAAFYNSIFRDMVWNGGGMLFVSDATVLCVDCIFNDLQATRNSIFDLGTGGSLRLVRTAWRNNRATSQGGGGGMVYGGATLEIVDSDITGCVSGVGGAAVVKVLTGGSVTITDSRLDGNIGTHNGVIADLEDDTSTLRIVRSTITNTTGPFAIYVSTETDFSVQLDTVSVDSTFDILSHSAVLLQNCEGLSSTAIKNASIGACGLTSEFCIPELCIDKAVGIECACFVDGAPTVIIEMSDWTGFSAQTVT